MATRTDDKFAALRDQGFTGSLSDMTLQWLQANGATSNQTSDAWLEMLAAQGFGPGQRNDLWHAFLGDIGYEGALPDRDAAFWADGGVIVQPTEYILLIGTNGGSLRGCRLVNDPNGGVEFGDFTGLTEWPPGSVITRFTANTNAANTTIMNSLDQTQINGLEEINVELGDFPSFTLTWSAANSDYRAGVSGLTNWMSARIGEEHVFVVSELEPEPPVIDTQPVPVTVTEPDPATFTVVASHPQGADLFYQWQAEDTPGGGVFVPANDVFGARAVNGQANSVFTVDPTEADDDRDIRCRVRAYGIGEADYEVMSDVVPLTVEILVP